MRRLLMLLSVFALLGCADGAPYCANFDDSTGRAVAFCPGPREDPVCDLEGGEAHFEMRTVGLELVGGLRAACNSERVVACPNGTVGEPYCILDPEL